MITLTIRKFRVSMLMLLIGISVLHGSYAQSLKGIIANYAKQPLSLYQCYGDTLLLVDSTHTDKNGAFSFFFNHGQGNLANLQNHGSDNGGLYKVVLQRNQWFYVLYDGKPTEIKTLFQSNTLYNIATDSLKILKSEENKRFYEFQNKQQQLNVANYFLLQMMRLYPLPDPFHKQIEDEYFKRYAAMEQLVNVKNLSGLIAKAYYQPVNPDWKQPDNWRDSIIAAHYFDYFNPSDSFYLHTNILPEKMDIYLSLRTNKRDAYGQPVSDKMLFATAAKDFLEKTASPQLLPELLFKEIQQRA